MYSLKVDLPVTWVENLSHTRNSILFLHLATSLEYFIGSSVTWQVMELLDKGYGEDMFNAAKEVLGYTLNL